MLVHSDSAQFGRVVPERNSTDKLKTPLTGAATLHQPPEGGSILNLPISPRELAYAELVKESQCVLHITDLLRKLLYVDNIQYVLILLSQSQCLKTNIEKLVSHSRLLSSFYFLKIHW